MNFGPGVPRVNQAQDARPRANELPERSQMKHKIMVGLYFLAGGLGIIAALRDIFAPGFFAMSGRVNSTSYIILEFALAITFLSLGAFFLIRGPKWHRK